LKFYNLPNIIPASTVMNATINSTPMCLLDSYSFSIQVVYTGTPTGIFTLQSSNDPAAYSQALQQKVGLPTNWSTVSNSSFSVSAAGDCFYDYQFPGFNWIRLHYVDSSSGSSTAIITVSSFNAKGN
jgi:hypothetical protein